MLKLKFLLIAIALACLPFGPAPARSAPEVYPDPTTDIGWSAGTATVTDIQDAFNNAHTQENAQLGTSIPLLTLPSQAEWDGYTDNQKAFWLMNHERTSRGISPWQDTEPSLINVAQNYADYLMVTNQFSHGADGHNPGWRMTQVPAIAACYQSWGENIAYFVTSGNSLAMPVERSVYAWLYRDSGSSWGHRHGILKDNFNDDSGTAGNEGFIAIGHAHGSFKGWNTGDVVVMDSFDPCATWTAPATTAFVAGKVTDNQGAILTGVQVSLSDITQVVTTTTDANGMYSFPISKAGAYSVFPVKTGSRFNPGQLQVTVGAANLTHVDFSEIVLVLGDQNTFLPAILTQR